MSRAAYTYAIVRYVHDAFSGESLNVAVALLDSNGNFEFKVPKSLVRVKKAFPDAQIGRLKDSLEALGTNLRSFIQRSKDATLADAFAWAAPEDESGFRASSVGAGLTSNVSATAHDLLERFVMRCDKEFDNAEVLDPDVHRVAWGQKVILKVIPAPSNDALWNNALRIASK